MKLNKKNKVTKWLIMMLLILTLGLITAGCGTKEKNKEEAFSVTEAASETKEEVTVEEETEAVPQSEAEVIVLGEGNTNFPFTVVDEEGNETKFEIHTDKNIVGEALMDVELIAGEEGEFGLYVKAVNGITADYDVNKTYWAFYIDNEYAVTGVDSTEIEEGAVYSFRIEK